MKRIFVTVVFITLSVITFASNSVSTFITVNTNIDGDNIEVIIVSHNGDVFTVARDGKFYNIHRRFLNISAEKDIAIELADNGAKELYTNGKKVAVKSVNKSDEDKIYSEILLSSLQNKSN